MIQEAAAPTHRTGAAARAARAASAAGPAWGVRTRLAVDLVLAVSFLCLMSVPLTGLPLHEWWGLALAGVIVLHLLMQWEWTVAATRRLFGSLGGRVRVTYLLNWLLFVAAVLAMASGMLISELALPSLGLPTVRSTGSSLFRFWRILHTVSADAVIVLAGIHLGLNWRWVTGAVRQLARLPRRSAAKLAAGGRA